MVVVVGCNEKSYFLDGFIKEWNLKVVREDERVCVCWK